MENIKTAATFSGVKDGETFKVGDFEFIKFPSANGMTPVVMKDIAFYSRFGKNNDLSCSTVLSRMQEEILPKIIEAIGTENVLSFKTDLTTLDGLKPYKDLESQISLPTMDFYRRNVAIFDKYIPETWWWLATPESAPPHYDANWILCVSPRGSIYDGHYDGIDSGVRPFLCFNSSIFGSSEA